MRRLGYTRYVAQGGDVGAAVTDTMAIQAPAGLAGIHLNFLRRPPPDVTAALFGGALVPEGLTEDGHAMPGKQTWDGPGFIPPMLATGVVGAAPGRRRVVARGEVGLPAGLHRGSRRAG